VGSLINGAAAKTTPADTDMVGLMDSAASNVLKKLSWANLKAALNTLYVALTGDQAIAGVKTFSNGIVSSSVKVGTSNTDADAVQIVNGAMTIASASTQAFKAQMEVDSSTVYISANQQYYSGSWALYDANKAGAAIRINSVSSDSSIAFYTQSSNATAATTAQFTIAKTGLLYSLPSYNNTAAASANMVIDSNGIFYRATSSIKYKKNVQDMTKVESESLYSFRPITYEAMGAGGVNQGRFIGFIAEEIEEVEPRLVFHAESGEPEGIQYDKIVVLLVAEVKALRARIEALENER
jgi:hypothetical protein